MFLSPNKSTLCSVQQSRCKVRIPEMYTIENMYVKLVLEVTCLIVWLTREDRKPIQPCHTVDIPLWLCLSLCCPTHLESRQTLGLTHTTLWGNKSSGYPDTRFLQPRERFPLIWIQTQLNTSRNTYRKVIFHTNMSRVSNILTKFQ